MKLKDFLKQFENEDPETEIVVPDFGGPNFYRKDILVQQIFVPLRFENDNKVIGYNVLHPPGNDIRMLRVI